MPTKLFKCFVLALFLSLISVNAKAENKYQTIITNHIERLSSDSVVSVDFIQDLNQINEWLDKTEQVSETYFSLLDKYLNYVNSRTYKSYNKYTHEDIISQALNILKTASQPSVDMKTWTYSLLPEYYSAVKTLMPADVSMQACLDMAKERPIELIGQFSRLFYSENSADMQNAILSSPVTIIQFMHYRNSVRTELEKSGNDTIKLMLDIYKDFRFNPNPYVLLPYIVDKELTPEQANQVFNDKTALIKYILPLLKNNKSLSSYTVKQKWNDISDELLQSIRKNRFLKPQDWDIASMDSLPTQYLIQVLFYAQNVMNASELTAFSNWIYYKNQNTSLSKEDLDKIGLNDIVSFANRLEQDEAIQVTHPLWKDLAWLLSYVNQKNRGNKEIETQVEINTATLNLQSKPKTPAIPEYIIKTYHFNLPQTVKDLIKWKSVPLEALESVDEWIDEPYALDLLKFIANQYPIDIVRGAKKIALKKQGIQALEYVAETAPYTIKNFVLQASHYWNTLFRNSKNEIIQTIYKVNQDLGPYSKAYLVLDDIYRGRVSMQEAENLCNDKETLTQRLIQLLGDTAVIGRFSIEQQISYQSLKFVRELNISENTDKLFTAEIQKQTPEVLYTYMTYGEDEIIYSSFVKMLQALLEKSPQQNIYPLLKDLNFNNFRKFARKCVDYNLFDKVYSNFSPSQKDEVLDFLLKNLEKNQDKRNEVVQIADIILGMNDDGLIAEFHQRLHSEYERVEKIHSDEGVAIYGILSALIARKVDKGWAKYVAEKYKLPNLERLPAYTLFNQKMENIQQYYFYNDQDGISSYSNFIRSYQRSPLEWEIKDYTTFVSIISRTGKKVEIYANKASSGETGIRDMLNYMKSKNLEPQVVVHRGLSTHTLKTFSRIPNSAKLILDGSCGGYHVQLTALKRAPEAQILCNRNVGTMFINDPMFKQINDDIRNGVDLDWNEFWTRMNQRVGSNPYFKDYIPPHKNAATILTKALYDILEIE